jgi:hypothetical protein
MEKGYGKMAREYGDAQWCGEEDAQQSDGDSGRPSDTMMAPNGTTTGTVRDDGNSTGVTGGKYMQRYGNDNSARHDDGAQHGNGSDNDDATPPTHALISDAMHTQPDAPSP